MWARLCRAIGIGKEAVIADALEAVRQNVEQKTADELDRFQRHYLGLVAAGIVFPFEGDSAIDQRD